MTDKLGTCEGHVRDIFGTYEGHMRDILGTHAYIHTYMRACIHTYIHTYIICSEHMRDISGI